jgi:hypothetical protein
MILGAEEAVTGTEYFAPLVFGGNRSFVAEAEALESAARIGSHLFFEHASENSDALRLWASQEAVVTNPFSQILFLTLSKIRNVHVRALLLPVIVGEHGKFSNDRAGTSHPWLIWELCRSLGIGDAPIVPTRAVRDFVLTLEKAVCNPMRALGALGIGNELMLISEYAAIERCFDRLFPEAKYKAFLDGNIREDEVHTQLIERAAVALANMGEDPREFVEGARLGVEARVTYYDALLREIV